MASTVNSVPLNATKYDQFIISGHALGNGSSTLATATNTAYKAGILSIAHTATGRYTITLEEKWSRLEDIKLTVGDTAYASVASAKVANPIAELVATSKTITFVVLDALSSFAPVDLSVTDILYFSIVLKNSAAGP